MIGNWLEIGHNAGGAVGHPVYPWVFEIGSYAAWIIIAAFFVRSYRRTGVLSSYALIFIGATTMFWLEFPADWGAFLIYSPKFTLFPIELPFTTPNKPTWMPAAYGWYFLAIYSLILFWVDKLRAAKPHMSRVLAVAMIATPFFYVWNMMVEGFSALVGWWTYYEVFGPAITFTRGTYPLVFPVIPFTIYGVIQTLMLTWKTPDGKHYIEKITGAHTSPIGHGKELRRALAWIIAMNLIFGMFALSTFLFRLMIS
ncbi:MAG: hypothetical protein KJ882_11780 [Proteobacteria bacterium]|nr:hypothetical protein [Pseudomonadota bacterium]MBU4036540.1 hypothetical protein [Pseudomonadota bacterium]